MPVALRDCNYLASTGRVSLHSLPEWSTLCPILAMATKVILKIGQGERSTLVLLGAAFVIEQKSLTFCDNERDRIGRVTLMCFLANAQFARRNRILETFRILCQIIFFCVQVVFSVRRHFYEMIFL